MKRRLRIARILLVAFCFGSSSVNAEEGSCALAASEESGSDSGAVLITATDGGFESPPCVSAGLRHFTFRNTGENIHEVMFIKLPDEMTAEQYVAAVRSGIAFPEGALDYSGPSLTSPGQEADFWLQLDPGNYVLFCWFKGHSADLPAHELLVVEDNAADNTPPQADVVVKLVDFRFDVIGEFKEGFQIIQFDTPGPSMHEADIFRFNYGLDRRDLELWYESGREGPAPISGHSGVLDSHIIGRTVWVKTELPGGRYILWCNLPMSTAPDAPGSAITHAMVGMTHHFEIPN